jgi:prepilin-type N-terminal cleavage/methylation domain-containing protein
VRSTGPRRQGGFTLVEMMASITVFSLMTLGIVPLFASSLKGASLSRSYTRGKNIAVEAMERARGLPFFIDYPTQKAYSAGGAVRKVDLLDLYFPIASSQGGTYSGGKFTTTCTSTSGANPACPRGLPPGFTMQFVAEFVRPALSGSTEQYLVQVPASTYRWNPEPYNGQDRPATDMLRLTIRSSWTYGGDPKTVELSSIIGNRDFGETTVSGFGRIDYAVLATTQFTNPATGRRTEVQGLAGTADSEIETKTQSTATETVGAARLTVNDLPIDGTGETVSLPPVDGARSSVQAPPDSTPGGASVGNRQAVHEVFGEVAGVTGTTTSNLKVSVSQELPVAEGAFGFSAPIGNERLFYVHGQLGPDNDSGLRLSAADPVLSFTRRGSGTLGGSSGAATGSVTSDRRVQTGASMAFRRLRLLPTNFIQSAIVDVDGESLERSVVVVDNFTASVSCLSTASSSAAASKSWSADLYYYRDLNLNDVVDGTYQRVSLSSAASSDALAGIGPASNPVVYDAPEGEEDIYLFQAGGRRGYLDSWNSAIGSTVDILDGGRVTRANITDALRIVSAPLDSRYAQSAVRLQIGKLSCDAQDDR